MTSPALLGELIEALENFSKLEADVMADIRTAHNRGPGASEWMREDDRDMRAELIRAFAAASAVLAKAKEAGRAKA